MSRSSLPRLLLLDANGFTWQHILYETVLRSVLRIPRSYAPPCSWNKYRVTRGLRSILTYSHYESLSYVLDWREAFQSTSRARVDLCMVNNLLDYRCKVKSRDYDLIVILHSALGDDIRLLRNTAHWFQGRKGKLAAFIGNEYDQMEDKVAFLREAGADYLCTQLPMPAAQWFYHDLEGTQLVEMPAALNPKLYRPRSDLDDRPIDIGFRGAFYNHFVGDQERNEFIKHVAKHGDEMGLRCDIQEGNVPRAEWAQLLDSSKGIVGAESNTYFLDRKGQLMAEAKRFCFDNPGIDFETVFNRFFNPPRLECVSAKSISSRHFEPIGTKTCQILLKGDYNGVLRPDEHYIGVNKDLSDMEEAVRKFKDKGFREQIVEQAYRHVLNSHTYTHRVNTLLDVLGV